MSDRLDRLKNHAAALELQLGSAEGSAYASLSGRYMDALRQIDEIEREAAAGNQQEGTALDEFSKRLAARKSGTAGSGRAAR